MKKSYIIIGIIIIILVAGGCFGLGFVLGKKSLEPTLAQYKKVIDYYNPILENTFGVSGEIAEIQDNALGLRTAIQNPYALPSEWETKIIKIIVTDKTEVAKFDLKEMRGVKISLSDLKVGDQISVTAGENIEDKTEFEATTIHLMTAPEMP